MYGENHIISVKGDDEGNDRFKLRPSRGKPFNAAPGNAADRLLAAGYMEEYGDQLARRQAESRGSPNRP
ncbi:hypothetical protein C7I87_13575 [Mesorhizobium sp. SARCC-RB16n]|nr:hypothetical protein C7I87_13575 [Mesorhizobium sp. SARCC-RB16n]